MKNVVISEDLKFYFANALQARQDSASTVIEKVIVVGGLLESSFGLSAPAENELSTIDSAVLTGGLLELTKRDVTFSDTLQISALNLIYGDDFLKEPHHTDLLVLGFVNFEVDKPVYATPTILESTQASISDSWKTAISESNSKYVLLSTDDYSTVGQRDIPENDYILVGRPDVKFSMERNYLYQRNEL